MNVSTAFLDTDTACFSPYRGLTWLGKLVRDAQKLDKGSWPPVDDDEWDRVGPR